ncbi:hypothetical protein [Streptomyces sp. NPDC101150]|uniref:hypothetical protein n=1 Tax=Streptomyces sp. NPDC101150 TaxID=3366114 RepID=UPI0038212DFA
MDLLADPPHGAHPHLELVTLDPHVYQLIGQLLLDDVQLSPSSGDPVQHHGIRQMTERRRRLAHGDRHSGDPVDNLDSGQPPATSTSAAKPCQASTLTSNFKMATPQ